jgi:hypothetical protein
MSSKLTPEIQQKIIENLATNPSLPSAAIRAGIAPSTLRDWLAKGEAGDERYAAFAQEVTLSRATVKDSVIAALIETACDVHHPQQVRAASKLLESLFPEEFSVVRHTIQHQAQEPALDLKKLPTAELRAFLKTLKRLRAEADAEPKPPVMVIEALEADAGQKKF